MRQFECIEGQMVIGGIKASDIAERFGTPVYCDGREGGT